jgi:hypothetical protein
VFLYVVVEERLHDIGANQGLHIGEELESLLIWDFTERVVWVVSFENWVKTRVGVLVSKGLDSVDKGCVSEEGLYLSEVDSVDFTADVAFNENGETFVNPEVLPILAGNFVSSPGVSHLMSSDVYLRLVTDNDGW